MDRKFIFGVPESLESHLTGYFYREICNISGRELRNNVVGYVQSGGGSMIIDEEKIKTPLTERVYFYFPRNGEIVDLNLAGHNSLCVALKHENYGFGEQKVEINPNGDILRIAKIDMDVAEKLSEKRVVRLDGLLEDVGFMVNDSIEYDFEKAVRNELNARELTGERAENFAEKYLAILRDGTDYVPSGREVMKGICSDAGDMIRYLLFNLGINDQFGMSLVSTAKGGISHDTTLVFDKNSGRWAIVNSKSPRKNTI